MSPDDTVASISVPLPSSHAVKSLSPLPNVFLYDKTCLLPESPLPVPLHLDTLIEEALTTHGKETEGGSEVSSHAAMSEAHHELDDAPSPVLRALPEYYRQFCRDAKCAWSAVKEATGLAELCSRLVNEIEVQAMAVDSAMSSVQPHYEFVCEMHKSFEDRCASLLSKHEDVLQTFTADVECLRSIQLVDECASALRDKMPSLSQQLHQQQDKAITLADLLPLEELESIAHETARSHRRLASRVKEVQRVHLSLRADVEALFLRSPSVDLDALSQELIQVQAASSELETALQLLIADCQRAKRAIEQGTTSLAEKMESVHVDLVGVLEAVHEAHIGSVLPRISECLTLIKSFATSCVQSKNVMAVDALLALRTIASEQSKIRQMKETLMPFPLAIDRQDSQVEKLLIVRRLPMAYKHALAECMRREAFNQKYKSFALDLEDRMNTFRFKEKSVRETFENKVKGVVPDVLLSAMGLDEDPPLFKVALVDSSESLESRLLHIVPDQLRSIHLPQHEAPSHSFLTSRPAQMESKSQTDTTQVTADKSLSESLSNRRLSGAASISTCADPQSWQEQRESKES